MPVLKLICCLCFILVCLPIIVKSQSKLQASRPYGQHQYLTPHTRTLPNGEIQVIAPLSAPTNQIQKQAEDRHIHWLKFIKKKKKKKLKFFKNHIKKCGFPFKFKIIKKSDDVGDDFDIIRIKLPYGYGEEYYPRANRRNDLNDTTQIDDDDTGEDDDDDDDDDNNDNSFETQNHLNSPLTKFPQNYPPMRYRSMVPHPLQIMRPAPHPMFMRIPPFKPIRGPVPVFGPPHFVPRRPWQQATPWAVARPGSFPPRYFLKEPLPGLIGGNPPVSPLVKIQTEKHIPLNKSVENVENDLKAQITNVIPNYVHQAYNPYQQQVQGHTAFSNPSTYNVKYSQPDYGRYGTYNVEENGSNLKSVVVVPPNKAEEEKVVTVTPTTLWVANSPRYQNNTSVNDKSGRSYLNGSPRLNSVRKLINEKTVTHQTWVPVTDSSKDDANAFRIIVEDDVETNKNEPEIITAKYPLDDVNELQKNFRNVSKPILITKRNINSFDPTKRLVYFNIADARKSNEKPSNNSKKVEKKYTHSKNIRSKKISHIPQGNSSRIRRPRIENMSTLVSGSMIVKEN